MNKFYLLTACVLLHLSVSAQTFTLKSNDIGGQATEKQVLNGFGCEGKNLSPQLYWENAPTGSKSFAITIFDESAPTGSGWWHWLVFDIPGSVSELKSGAGTADLKLAPAGSIQSMTDFSTMGYGGPCPPPGSNYHRYIITVYALNTEKLGLGANSNPALVAFNLEQHIIAKSSIVFYYKR
jgi:Raf kinase inhibitor-like YbhB/YbcL family protein